MATAIPERPSFKPRNWPGWISVALLWLLGRTPQWLALALSIPLGWMLRHLMKGRRKIAQHNIARCFPEKSEDQLKDLIKHHFQAVARMIFETPWVWTASDRRLNRMCRSEGDEYIEAERCKGRGVLLVTAHSTSMELSAWKMARNIGDPWLVYRPLKNPVMEWFQNRGRSKFTAGVIGRSVFASMVQLFSEGGVCWYAPDQDFGPERSLFVPFFGFQTATLKATVDLAESSGCSVIPMFSHYDETKKKYVSQVFPALENFPSGEAVRDLERINQLMEEHIRQYPAQYWWIHRRFKTRPDGEPPFYD